MSPQELLASVRRKVTQWRACPLWHDATQTVFGEGPPRAVVMLVGEQPGDREDRRASHSSGRPGPCSTMRSSGQGSSALAYI
jgi:DNA polymerase